MKRAMQAIVVAGLLAAVAGAAFADGMIVPVRDDVRVRGHWAVKYHRVNMIVRDQVAAVTIDQEFINTGGQAIEVEYLFPVPPGAAIDAMTMVVGGQELKGKLLPADEARKIYEDIVRRKKDPALLEYVGYGLYRTRAFPLEPGKPAHVLVHYNHVCRKDREVVEVFYPLNTEKFSAKSIDEVSVTADIKTDADITTVYSPTHEIKCDRRDARHVVVTYKVQGAIPNTDFVILYKARDEQVGATLLTYQPDAARDGYFMLLASPNPKVAQTALIPKDVVLVIDRSGSMSSDNKIGQAREALQFVLKNLNPEDRFSVIAYNDGVDTFFPDLVAAGKDNLATAADMAARLEAMGGTNIHEALRQAMEMVRKGKPDGDRPAYVIFLTDGLPTVGKTDEATIIADTAKTNDGKARLFALGVGYDVNVRLLDRLVAENRGFSDYVKPNEPLEAKVSGMYAKVRNPVMTDLKLSIQDVAIRDYYPRTLGDLFDGSQLVVVGRYDARDADRLRGRKSTLVITGAFQGKERGFEYTVAFKEPGVSSMDSFVERLWAVRRVGFLLDEIQLRGKSQEVIDEVIRLSRDYGIMTPYTSFLADETTNIAKVADMREKGLASAEELKRDTSGAEGQRHAMARQALNDAYYATPATQAAPVDVSGKAKEPAGAVGYGARTVRRYEAGEKEVYTTVQNVGNQTLYRRGQVWVTPDTAEMDVARDADRIKKVQRYTEEYFALVRANTAAENQILANQQPNEQLLIRLRSQVYLIE